MKTRNIFLIVLALVLCLSCLFIAGCAGGGDDTGDGTTTKAPAGTTTKAPETTTEPPETTTKAPETTQPEEEIIVPEFVRGENEFYVDGSKILDPDGNEFVPFGANVAGPYSWSNRETTQDIGLMVDTWNFNTVRLYTYASPTWSGNYPSTDYDAIIDAFTEKGVVVMLEMHDFTGTYPSDKTNLTLKRFAGIWKNFANKYKDNTYVWFNIMNEPGNGAGSPIPKQWHTTHETVIKYIRSTGARNVIVCDGHNWASDFGNSGTGDVTDRHSCILKYGPELLKYGNIIYSVHMYNWQFAPQKFLNYVDSIHAKGMVVICGEVGVSTENYSIKNSNVLGTICALNAYYQKKVGYLHWAWQDPNLPVTLEDSVEYGTWETTFDKDGNPTNLSWIGRKFWDAAQYAGGKIEALDAIDKLAAEIEMIVADRIIDADTNKSRFAITVNNSGDVLVPKESFTVEVYVNDTLVDSIINDKYIAIQKSLVLETKPIDLPAGEFTIKAVIKGNEIPAEGEEAPAAAETYDLSAEFSTKFTRAAAPFTVTDVYAVIPEGEKVAARDNLKVEAVIERGTMSVEDFKKLNGSFFFGGTFISIGKVTVVDDDTLKVTSERTFPVNAAEIYLSFRVTGTDGGNNAGRFVYQAFEGLTTADFGLLPWGTLDVEMSHSTFFPDWDGQSKADWVNDYNGVEFQFWGKFEVYVKDGIMVVPPSTDGGTGCAFWLKKGEVVAGGSYTLVAGAYLDEDATKDPESGKYTAGTMEIGFKYQQQSTGEWIQSSVSVVAKEKLDYELNLDIPATDVGPEFYIFVWINGGETIGYIDYITLLEK